MKCIAPQIYPVYFQSTKYYTPMASNVYWTSDNIITHIKWFRVCSENGNSDRWAACSFHRTWYFTFYHDLQYIPFNMYTVVLCFVLWALKCSVISGLWILFINILQSFRFVMCLPEVLWKGLICSLLQFFLILINPTEHITSPQM